MPIPIPIAIETRGRGVKNPIDDSISTANQRMSRTQGILVMTIPTMIRKLSFPNNPITQSKTMSNHKIKPILKSLNSYYILCDGIGSIISKEQLGMYVGCM